MPLRAIAAIVAAGMLHLHPGCLIPFLSVLIGRRITILLDQKE
jgi:hypothetical protein